MIFSEVKSKVRNIRLVERREIEKEKKNRGEKAIDTFLGSLYAQK